MYPTAAIFRNSILSNHSAAGTVGLQRASSPGQAKGQPTPSIPLLPEDAGATSDSTTTDRPNSSARSIQEAAWRQYVARCAGGDQDALAALYDESSRVVYSVILMIVKNPADGEEVTLDVYTTVWNRALLYDDSRGSVFGWLVMLARSRAIDRIRSRARRQQREAGSDFLAFAAPGPSPEGQADATQQRGQLMEALKLLSPEERNVLLLAFYQGHTHSELAELLQQPLGTVKTRIRSGMAKLRRQLQLLAT